MEENYFKMSRVRKNKKINLFIDVTKISNKSGSEKIGVNFEYKKKNVTSLSAICDDNKIPLGITYMDTRETSVANLLTKDLSTLIYQKLKPVSILLSMIWREFKKH